MSDFNSNLIADLRANDGTPPTDRSSDRPMVILTTVGAQVGRDPRDPPRLLARWRPDRHHRLDGRGAESPVLVSQPRRPAARHRRDRWRTFTAIAHGRRWRRTPPPLRPARRDQSQLPRVRGPHDASGDPGHHPAARGLVRRRLTLRSADGRRRGAGPAGRPPPSSPTSPAMHAANRAAWDEAAERYEGWFDEAVALIRSGGTNLFGVETELIGDLHGRCRRAIHLQCAGGRDTLSLWNLGRRRGRRRRLQPAHARAGRPPDRGDRRPGPLDPVRRAGHPGTSSMAPPTSSTRVAARSSGSRTSTRGRPSSPGCSPRPDGSCCSRAIRPSGCSTPTRTAAGSRPTTTTSVAPEASRGWAPEYIDRLSIADADQSWKFARAWTLGEVVTALLGADLRLERGRRAPDRLVGRPRRRARRGARPDPAVVLGRRAQGCG